MSNLILSTLSILALLIHPLSLSAQNSFSISLDVNSTAGDQAVTSVTVSADEAVTLQIFGKDIQNTNGLAVRFEYNATQVVYEGFEVGNVLPNAQALPEQGTNPTFVEISIASFGRQVTVNSGLIGTIRFRTLTAFSGTEIRLVRADLGRGGQIESVTLNLRVALQLQRAVTPDFDGDGRVGFSDFLAFAGQFGSRQGDGRYEARYDLDSNGAIGFSDFLIFGSSFGKEVSPPGGSATMVAIPDANLRAVIEDSLGKAVGAPISRAEMATLTRLEAPNANISDLTGLEFANRLTSLNFGHDTVSSFTNSNSISDLLPLSSLTNLESLDLARNNITDVSALSSLTNLESLDLYINNITDVSALSSLTNLESLNLARNSISDIPPLAELTRLDTLNLASNSISDISPLSGLTNLETLWLYNNSISDISPLSGLTNLTALSLSSNSISDISPLSGLTNLERLILSSNSISDISPLVANMGLSAGDNVNVRGNPLSDTSLDTHISTLQGREVEIAFDPLRASDRPLPVSIPDANLRAIIEDRLDKASGAPITRGEMVNITRLFVSSANISDLTGLEFAPLLRSLYLSSNSISDVSALSGLTNLTTLWIHSNNISDISPLSGLTSLETLYLSNNSISDVSALSGLTNLESLYLAYNFITDISALSGLTSLKTLYLDNNVILHVPALSGLTSLVKLYLSFNNISDISTLSGLTSLETLILATTASQMCLRCQD